MKRSIFSLLFLLILIPGRTQDEQETPDHVKENKTCLQCHGNQYYYYYNDWVERDIKERMNPYYIIDSSDYYHSVHHAFYCIDCHSTEYEEFPHAGYLRMEYQYTCLDCHGGDETYAQYNFEQIQVEFERSVHSTRHNEAFTCWMCHDPHSYQVSARSERPITETVAYDNEICLSCHANVNKFKLLTDRDNPNVIESHDWLPNQPLHFRKVRCIECHAKLSDTLLVAHEIQPKSQAVKKCVECHSSNSLLLASLYKYQAQEKRSKAGFFNAAIMNEAYVIGANRNYYLNVISAIIFGLVIFGIAIHAILRIIKK